MGWVDRLRGATVALDTAPLIYFIEEHPKYLSFMLPFFQWVDDGEIRCVTSVITLTETLVHPLRLGRADIAEKYLNILLDSNRVTEPVTPEIAEQAARLRANQKRTTPDAIQISTAIRMNATTIVTNDLRIPSVKGIEILNVDDFVGHSP